mmetsp:Transcript_65168/g.188945  ORF Transcript_65168/g.188945 Transcript_65168/m.188945 type:complete len:326 (-) Transcript_65168:42-1019(-)
MGRLPGRLGGAELHQPGNQPRLVRPHRHRLLRVLHARVRPEGLRLQADALHDDRLAVECVRAGFGHCPALRGALFGRCAVVYDVQDPQDLAHHAPRAPHPVHHGVAQDLGSRRQFDDVLLLDIGADVLDDLHARRHGEPGRRRHDPKPPLDRGAVRDVRAHRAIRLPGHRHAHVVPVRHRRRRLGERDDTVGGVRLAVPRGGVLHLHRFQCDGDVELGHRHLCRGRPAHHPGGEALEVGQVDEHSIHRERQSRHHLDPLQAGAREARDAGILLPDRHGHGAGATVVQLLVLAELQQDWSHKGPVCVARHAARRQCQGVRHGAALV